MAYKVSFFKTLLSSEGHQFKCLQATIEIHRAWNVSRAVQAAERRFARFHRVPDWTLHADTIEVAVDGKTLDYCPSQAERADVRHSGSVHSMHH